MKAEFARRPFSPAATEHKRSFALASRSFQGKQAETRQPETADERSMPPALKREIENLSGFSLDDVRIHHNSARPAELGALAFTEGRDIHVAPGQEKHMPHEAWHVVQQKQGRVKQTRQMSGKGLNDNRALEREADVMGQKAQRSSDVAHRPGCACASCAQASIPAQSMPRRSPVGATTSPVTQMMCEKGHAHHAAGKCPEDYLERTQARGVKLGAFHKKGSEKAGKSKTTPKVEERLTRHMSAALEGQPSKARMTGIQGQNIMWQVDRAKAEKQGQKGPRNVLQHIGGGGEDDPLDFFEAGHDDMSETDDESDEL